MINFSKEKCVRGVALWVLAAGLLAQGQTHAQESQDAQEITITGSRIKAPNLTSESPVTAVSDAEIKQQGTTNLENLLNELPSVYASQGNTTSNGSNGTATLNLRALGADRTLVLIDGRRIGPGDPRSALGSAADINFIPAILVSGVEVLTGGASAVYGSDAVAGVVNFHLLKNFDGAMFDETYTADQHSQHSGFQSTLRSSPVSGVSVPGDQFDGFIRDTSGVVGSNSANGKGNVTLYADYRATTPVLAGTRDWDACGAGANAALTSLVCTGSSTTNYGHFVQNGTNKIYSNNPNGTATFVPYTSALAYNFNPSNYLQRQDDRTALGTLGHYQVKPWLDLYTELEFMRDSSVAQIAGGGLFNATTNAAGTPLTIPCNNQYLSAAEATTLCVNKQGQSLPIFQANGQPNVITFNTAPGLRFTVLPRQLTEIHEDYRAVAGGRGDIDENWSFDVSASYWDTEVEEQASGYASFSRLENSLSGCTNGDSACVPINIFQFNGVTPAAANYVSVPGLSDSGAREMTVDFNITGDLGGYGIKSPFAHNSVATAFGFEYRRDELSIRPDNEYQTGDLEGLPGNQLPVSGAEADREYYGELRVPLAEDLAFIRSVNLDLALRHSDYDVENSSSTFSTNTYKITADYAPTDDLRFRGGYNRAARAPSVYELFQPQTFGVESVTSNDPCSGAHPLASLSACQASGVTATQYGNILPCTTNQCEQRVGGNTALRPEEADTWTWGVNLTPSFLPGFNASIDYWDVRVDNYITSESGTSILNGCLLQGVGSLCQFIHRNPNTGDIYTPGLGYVTETATNFGFLHNRGIDVEANYRKDLSDFGLTDLGSLIFKMNGTAGLQSTISGTTTYNCQGLYGTVCDANGATDPRFDWRHTARLTWSTPWDMDLSLNWRYLSSVLLDTNSSQKGLNNGHYDSVDARIPAYSYFDLSASWRVWNNYTLRAGVNNVFDKDPPVLNQSVVPTLGATNGNTYSGAYDTLGRVMFAGFNAKF